MLVAYTTYENIATPCGLIVDVNDTSITVRTYRQYQENGDVEGAAPVDGSTIDARLDGQTIALSEPQVFDIASLIALNQGYDYACIIFPLICRADGLRGYAGDRSWQVNTPYNRTKETMIARRSPYEHFDRTREHTLMHFYVPHKAATASECALHLIIQDGFYPIVTGSTPVEQPVASTVAQVMPTLSMPTNATVTHDQFVSIPVSSNSNATLTVHMETTSGYITHQRIQVVNGSGSIKVGALGLDVGEKFKVKAGFRYFPGVTETIVEVV